LFGGMMEKLRTMSSVKKKKPSVPLNKSETCSLLGQTRMRRVTLNDKGKMVDGSIAQQSRAMKEIWKLDGL
jgi:hypothetical protein